MSNARSSQPFAEVIASSLATYTAQCWKWDTAPEFGSLVSTSHGDHTIWGIVSNIETGSSDAQRYPFPYQKTEEELKAEHPQIFEFLATTFQVTIVAYQQNERIFYTLPAQPAKIHSFVSPASVESCTRFFSSPSFLPPLFAAPPQGPHVDELLLAVCRNVARNGLLTPALFEQYYHTFSLLIGNDYRRLKLLLQRINASHAQQLTAPNLRSTA